jgi:type I restriction enzyme S subunit
MIPADWELMTANQIGTPVRGGSPRPAGDRRYFDGSYIPWLTVAALTNIPASQLIVSETASYLTEEGSMRSRTLQPGTLIIANSGATLGVAKLLAIKCCANDGIAALLNIKSKVNPCYLVHYINSRTDYLRNVVATGNGQPNLNTKLIGDFAIPLPPTEAEQDAIAEALSDADAHIESQEQLLTKKRHLKQGAIQELLNGKKRLPGFSGEWEVKRLDKIAHIKTGGRNNQDKIEDGQYPFFVRSATVERINSYSHDCEAILIPGEGGIGSIFHYIHGRFDVHQRVYAITQFSPDISGKYVFFYIVKEFGAHAMANSVRATVDSLRLPTFQNFEIAMPPTEAEQTAIAETISDMDAEIVAQEAKLAKARDIKQGMMQELLTGRIRLV